MKVKLNVNLKSSTGFFHKGFYEGDIPKALIAEIEAGTGTVEEIALPNVAAAKTKKKPGRKPGRKPAGTPNGNAGKKPFAPPTNK